MQPVNRAKYWEYGFHKDAQDTPSGVLQRMAVATSLAERLDGAPIPDFNAFVDSECHMSIPDQLWTGRWVLQQLGYVAPRPSPGQLASMVRINEVGPDETGHIPAYRVLPTFLMNKEDRTVVDNSISQHLGLLDGTSRPFATLSAVHTWDTPGGILGAALEKRGPVVERGALRMNGEDYVMCTKSPKGKPVTSEQFYGSLLRARHATRGEDAVRRSIIYGFPMIDINDRGTPYNAPADARIENAKDLHELTSPWVKTETLILWGLIQALAGSHYRNENRGGGQMNVSSDTLYTATPEGKPKEVSLVCTLDRYPDVQETQAYDAGLNVQLDDFRIVGAVNGLGKRNPATDTWARLRRHS